MKVNGNGTRGLIKGVDRKAKSFLFICVVVAGGGGCSKDSPRKTGGWEEPNPFQSAAIISFRELKNKISLQSAQAFLVVDGTMRQTKDAISGFAAPPAGNPLEDLDGIDRLEVLTQLAMFRYGDYSEVDFSVGYLQELVHEITTLHVDRKANGEYPHFSGLKAMFLSSQPPVHVVLRGEEKFPGDECILVSEEIQHALANLCILDGDSVKEQIFSGQMDGIDLLKTEGRLARWFVGLSPAEQSKLNEDLLQFARGYFTKTVPSPYIDFIYAEAFVAGLDPHSRITGFNLKSLVDEAGAEDLGLELSTDSPAPEQPYDATSAGIIRDQPDAADSKLMEMFVQFMTQANVTGSRGDRFSYVRLREFRQSAAKDLERVLDQVADEQQGIVLDLRGNPGGYASEAARIVRLFTDSPGDKFYAYSAGGFIPFMSMALESVFAPGLSDADSASGSLVKQKVFLNPLVVLIDEGSASASEMVASSLKDSGRALLLGEKTFGKGSFYSERDASILKPNKFSLNVKFHVTEGFYFDASHFTPQIQGVEPHFLIAKEGDRGIREEDMPGALPARSGREAFQSKNHELMSSSLACLQDLNFGNSAAITEAPGVLGTAHIALHCLSLYQ